MMDKTMTNSSAPSVPFDAFLERKPMLRMRVRDAFGRKGETVIEEVDVHEVWIAGGVIPSYRGSYASGPRKGQSYYGSAEDFVEMVTG